MGKGKISMYSNILENSFQASHSERTSKDISCRYPDIHMMTVMNLYTTALPLHPQISGENMLQNSQNYP